MKKIIPICISSMILMSGSSVDLKLVESYSADSKVVTSNAADLYSSVNLFARNNDIHNLVVTDQVTLSKLKGVSSPSFSASNEVKGLKVRLQLLESMTAYASGLEALAKTDNSENLKEETTSLYQDLNGLRENYKEKTGRDLYSKKDAALVSSAFNGLSKIYTENQKKSLIKEVIVKTDPAISMSCDAIVSDVRIMKNSSEWNKITRSVALNNAISTYANEKHLLSYEEKIKRVNSMLALLEKDEDPLNKLIVSVESLKKAHNAMRNSLSSRVGFNLGDAKDEISALSKARKEAKNYYTELLK